MIDSQVNTYAYMYMNLHICIYMYDNSMKSSLPSKRLPLHLPTNPLRLAVFVTASPCASVLARVLFVCERVCVHMCVCVLYKITGD